jgi:CRP/FNR family transcriptional regulator, polysaccharide utilization system transcription regulator
MTCRALNCAECSRTRPGILQGGSDETLANWDKNKKVFALKRGQILFHEGQVSKGLYCIDAGRLKLYRSGPGGELQIVRLVGPGQLLGHRSLFSGQEMSATAEVLQDATVCFVEGSIVKNAAATDSQISMNFLKMLAAELGQAEAHLFSVARLSATVRLSKLLLELADPSGSVCPLTREEMGQVIGITSESVSRTLSLLCKAGAIELRKRNIEILSLPMLQQFAQE